MADRKASVELELRASQFKAEAASAGKSVDGLDRDVEKLDRDINRLGPDAIKAGVGLGVLGESAKKTSEDVDGLGQKSDTTGDKADKLGKKSKDTSTALRLLGIEAQDAGDRLVGVDKKNSLSLIDDKIKSIRAEMKSLAAEFNKTGDVSILDKLSSGQEGLAALGKLKDGVTGALQAAVDDPTIFEFLKDNIQKAFEGGFTSPGGIAVIGQVLVPALAAIGGLAAGIAGAGVAGLGVLGAVFGDPTDFQREWQTTLRTIKADFLDASAPFVGPALDGLKTVGPTVASWHLKEALAPATAYVPELVSGVERFATGVVHGVAALADKGGPAVAVLSTEMGDLGDAADSAFSSIADGAEGGAEALHDVLTAVNLVVEGFGKVTEGAENAYLFIQNHPIEAGIGSGGLTLVASFFTNLVGNASDVHGKFTLTAKGAAEAAREAGHAFSEEGVDLTALQQGLNAAAQTTDAFIGKQVSGALNGMLSLDQATLQWHQTLTNLHGSITRGKDALNENTAAGQKNVGVVLGAVQANIQMYQANIASGITAIDAASAYDAGTAALNRQLRAAGLTQAQIDGLIGKYKNVPDQVNTNIAIEGLTNAINDLDDLMRRLNHIPSRKDVTIYTHTGTVGGKEGPALYAQGGIRHAAEGLIVPPRNPGTVLFGEPQTGGEAFIPLRGISQHAAMGLAQTVGNAYGFQVSRPSSSSGWSGPMQLTYSGPTGGLDGVFAGWLAEQSRQGHIQIHARSVVA